MTIGVDAFHGRNEWNVLQELYAHFNLIAMTRMFTISGNDLLARQCEGGRQRQTINFNHAVKIVAANPEELLLTHARMVAHTVNRMAGEILRIRSCLRPDCSFPGKSMKPSTSDKYTEYAH